MPQGFMLLKQRPVKYPVKISVRLTREEKVAFRVACADVGLRYSDVLRRMVIDMIDIHHRRREKRSASAHRSALRREMGKRGELTF